MRIAITGATGNLGTALRRRLSAADEDYDVVGLARRAPDTGGDWVETDLAHEQSATRLREAFDGVDAVVHLAWGFQPSHDLDYLEELGVGGTRRVLEAARATGVPHLVHMSSVGAYSAKVDDAPVDESWPTEGIPSSPYSRHKAAAESLLDAVEREGWGLEVCRLRPGIVGQRAAGSALLRYGVPAYVPRQLISALPVLPLDRRLAFPAVHADDVAAAVESVLRQRAHGAFNLAAPPAVTTEVIARALDARAVHVPAAVLRPAVAAAWRLRLQQVDPGWLDLAMQVPLLDTTRALEELGWEPTVPGDRVLAEMIDGITHADSAATPALRRTSVVRRVGDALRRGPVASRHEP